MRPANKLITLLDLGSYRRYVTTLAPVLWYRLDETTGAVAVNYGSLGAGQNGAYTACTLGQAGKLGSHSAALFDGTTSLVNVPAGTYANHAAYTFAFLCKATSLGESSGGRFFAFGSSLAHALNLLAGPNIRSRRDTDTTDASVDVSGVPATGTWAWIFTTYDNAGDRKPYVYKGQSGVVSLLPGAQTAGTGTMTDDKALPLILGNLLDASRTFDGLIDEVLEFNKILTTAQMLKLTRLTGV